MALINIDGSSDIFYRYKMHQPELMCTGNHTIILNAEQLGKELGRPIDVICKFMSKRMGVRINKKLQDKKQVLIVSGQHTKASILEVLREYIDKKVLCPQCKNPETDVDLKICKACGVIKKVKPQHFEVVFE